MKKKVALMVELFGRGLHAIGVCIFEIYVITQMEKSHSLTVLVVRAGFSPFLYPFICISMQAQ